MTKVGEPQKLPFFLFDDVLTSGVQYVKMKIEIKMEGWYGC